MLGTATKLATPRKIAVSGAVSGSANFDGSGNVTITTTQANIAVLTGTMTLQANENGLSDDMFTTDKKIDFPTGFTKNNCIVLAIGIKNNASAHTLGYVYGSTATHHIFVTADGFFPARVIIGEPDKLRLCVDNWYNSTPTIAYKIVLMKVS